MGGKLDRVYERMRLPAVLLHEAAEATHAIQATHMPEIIQLPEIIELTEVSELTEVLEKVGKSVLSAFELRSVSVNYGDLIALSDVSLSVSAGETVGLLGSSGSGKSTLLGVCGGRVPIASGSAHVAGHSVAVTAHWQREFGSEIGFIPQQLHLAGRLRVIHNVNAGMLGRWSTFKALRSLLRPVDELEVDQILDRVGLSGKRDQRTDRLSGGEQQRVAIARTLRQGPMVVLADEPTASLDPARSLDVMQLLCRLAKEDGRALLVSQHDIETAKRTCDRLIGLKAGRIMFDLPSSAVTSQVAAELYGT